MTGGIFNFLLIILNVGMLNTIDLSRTDDTSGPMNHQSLFLNLGYSLPLAINVEAIKLDRTFLLVTRAHEFRPLHSLCVHQFPRKAVFNQEFSELADLLHLGSSRASRLHRMCSLAVLRVLQHHGCLTHTQRCSVTIRHGWWRCPGRASRSLGKSWRS